MLRIEHLRKRFGSQLVLDDVSLTVEKGEIVCVIGESGGGKSVILKHIIGLIAPDGGQVFFGEERICSPTTKAVEFEKYRKHFGMLFQGAALFDSKSVGENIAFPLREHTDMTEQEIADVIADALEKVGLQQAFAAKMPAELSGGMRSRVGLARALVMKPDVMLYDEPTSALDPIMTDKINDLIVSLRDKLKMTSIVVTHDIGSAYKIADKICMLYQGKIIFEGTPGEIRASRNPYIQQFIRSQRKHHYAVEEETNYQQKVDLRSLRMKTARERRASAHPTPSAALDSTTGLPGKEAFLSALQEEIERTVGSETSIAVAVTAIDSFDQITMELGDGFAQTVHAEVAKRLEDTIRGTDMAGVVGSGMIALALTKIDEQWIEKGVERIRVTACDIDLETPTGQHLQPTVSCGITILSRHDETAEVLLEAALASLRKAQSQGGNRTFLS